MLTGFQETPDYIELTTQYTRQYTHFETEPHPWTGKPRSVAYKPTTICNNFELEAIIARADAKSLSLTEVLALMHDRIGQPSPRQSMTFDQLPRM